MPQHGLIPALFCPYGRYAETLDVDVPCNRSLPSSCRIRPLLGSRTFRVTADDLDLICREFSIVVALELDVFDEESPNIVTESIGLKVALNRQSSLDYIAENFSDCLIEIAEDFHSELWFDSTLVD